MKSIKFFAMLFAFAAMSFSFVSCGGDDDDDVNNSGEINTGETITKYTKNSKDELEVTQKSAIVTQVHNAKFDKDSYLKSYIVTSTWVTEDMAKTYYDEMKGDSIIIVSKNGKKVIADMTVVFGGASYSQIKDMFDAMISGD